MSLQLPLAVWGAGPPASTSSSAAGTTDIFNIQYSAATADCRGRGLQAVTSSYFHFKYLSSSTPHHTTSHSSALLKYLNRQYCSIAEEVEVRAAQFWAGCVLTGRLLARWQFSQRGVDMCWPEYPCQHHDTQHTVHLTHTHRQQQEYISYSSRQNNPTLPSLGGLYFDAWITHWYWF